MEKVLPLEGWEWTQRWAGGDTGIGMSLLESSGPKETFPTFPLSAGILTSPCLPLVPLAINSLLLSEASAFLR